MDINIDQMKDLVSLFEKSSLSEITIKGEDYEISLKKNPSASPAGSAISVSREISSQDKMQEGEGDAAPKPGSEVKQKSDGHVSITSPIVGTFYRSSSPDAEPYIDVGDRIEEGDTVCIVEAMKVMNEVKSELTGTIVEICVDDGTSVEYGEELFIVDPDGQSQ